MQGKRKVLSNAVIYSVCAILTSAISFFMLPIYTSYMAPEQYGIVTVVLSFINVCSILVTGSVANALLRFWTDNREKTKDYFSTLSWLCILVSIIFMAATIPFRDYLSQLVFGDKNYYLPYLVMGIIALIAAIPTTIFTGIMQAMQQAKTLSILNFGRAILYVVLNVIFIVNLHLSAFGMLLSLMIANAAMSLGCILVMANRKQLTFRLRIKTVIPLFKYSIPLIPHSLSSNVANLITKTVMSNYQSLSITGVYSTALQIGSFMDIVQSSMNNAFRPWFNERAGDERNRDEILDLVKLLFSVTCVLFISISLFSQEVVYIMTDEAYHSAWMYVPIIVFSSTVRYIYYTHMLTILYDTKLSRIAFVCSLSGSLGNMLLDFILVPRYSGIGAAISLVASIFVMCIITVTISRKKNLYRFSLSALVKRLILSVILVLIGLLPTVLVFKDQISALNIVFKSVVMLASMTLFFWPMRDRIKNSVISLLQKKH